MEQQDHSSTKRKPAKPCIMVIFGITGDLTKRLLFPAICNLGSNGLLDENFRIIGVGIEAFNDEVFRAQLNADIDEFVTDPDAKVYGKELTQRLHYIAGDFADTNTYSHLKCKIDELVANKASKN